MPVTSSKKKRSNATLLKANSQLGMNHRTASHLLTRNIFYSLLVETGRDSCLRCAEKLTPDSYSIEHIEEWLDSEDPLTNFHSIENIDFVCKRCNSTYNRGRIDVRRSGIPLVKPIARPTNPLTPINNRMITKNENENINTSSSRTRNFIWSLFGFKPRST